MPGAGQLPFQFPIWLWVVISIIVSIVSVLVAFDARERGVSKVASICWFLAVQFFFPIVLLYLLLRRTVIKAPGPPQQPEQDNKSCPYCGATLQPDARICSQCRKLL